MIWDEDGGEPMAELLPAAKAFVRAFDKGEPVQPISFEIEEC